MPIRFALQHRSGQIAFMASKSLKKEGEREDEQWADGSYINQIYGNWYVESITIPNIHICWLRHFYASPSCPWASFGGILSLICVAFP
jgi:hypothetical protein